MNYNWINTTVLKFWFIIKMILLISSKDRPVNAFLFHGIFSIKKTRLSTRSEVKQQSFEETNNPFREKILFENISIYMNNWEEGEIPWDFDNKTESSTEIFYVQTKSIS
jgi:hypothetical protein